MVIVLLLHRMQHYQSTEPVALAIPGHGEPRELRRRDLLRVFLRELGRQGLRLDLADP